MQKNHITKSEQLIVVGGGITQEIGAFSCALYKRGVSWVYFPTTLLSMCDSCLGGKASLNYRGVKNQLGLFSNPSQIYIYSTFLKTLSDSEIKSGLGEILKSCFIGGEYFINLYREHIVNGEPKSFSCFKSLIMTSLMIKKMIIEADQFELNYRRCLNYGHTFGHAIEALSNYEIPHGLAIAAGMMMANKLHGAQEFNYLCLDLLDKFTLTFLQKLPLEKWIELIQQDKKMVDEQVVFVMMDSPGNMRFKSYDLQDLQIGW
jgi:3-dehydroquinate synthase